MTPSDNSATNVEAALKALIGELAFANTVLQCQITELKKALAAAKDRGAES